MQLAGIAEGIALPADAWANSPDTEAFYGWITIKGMTGARYTG